MIVKMSFLLFLLSISNAHAMKRAREFEEHSSALSAPYWEMKSKERFKLHERTFNDPLHLASCALPLFIEKEDNKKILMAIIKMRISKTRYPIINKIVDTWTSGRNFKSIVGKGAFFGNKTLRDKNIAFDENAMAPCDVDNIDGDVICFCGGGFVDTLAFKNKSNFKDLIRVRIDLTKIKTKGFYNQFFKAIDLCVPHFSVAIKVTDNLTISVDRKLKRNNMLYYTFKIGDRSETIELLPNDLIFYGDLSEINFYCIILPFKALELCADKDFMQLVYHEWCSLSLDEIERAIITVAQNTTSFSEYNFNSMLELTSNLIHDVHMVKNNKTYAFHQLPPAQYCSALNDFVQKKNLGKLDVYSEKICEMRGEDLFVYGQNMGDEVLMNERSANFGIIDPKIFPLDLFEKGYVETRPSTRKVNEY